MYVHIHTSMYNAVFEDAHFNSYFPFTWSYWFGELKSSSTVAARNRVELHKATSSTTVSTSVDNDDDDVDDDSPEVTIRPEERLPLTPGHPASSAAYGASETMPALRIEGLSKVSII